MQTFKSLEFCGEVLGRHELRLGLNAGWWQVSTPALPHGAQGSFDGLELPPGMPTRRLVRV
jgi:hypothetical protein